MCRGKGYNYKRTYTYIEGPSALNVGIWPSLTIKLIFALFILVSENISLMWLASYPVNSKFNGG